MKRAFLAIIAVFMTLSLAGCGDGSSTPIFVTDILSDPAFDGDIAKDANTGAFTVTQGNTQSVFAGIDPVTNKEFRAFLDFPLTGAGGVPGNAIISSAVLDIEINSIQTQTPTDTIPIRIELVSFQPPNLVGTDFDRVSQRALAFTTIIPPISRDDSGKHVIVDVTSLMIEAQRSGLADFQVRILEDLVFDSRGLIEINDTTGANQRLHAPLLEVTYF